MESISKHLNQFVNKPMYYPTREINLYSCIKKIFS